MSVKQFIATADQQIQHIVANGKTTDSRLVIARYAAAIAGNFQLWLVSTKPRDDDAVIAVQSNFACEKFEDHRNMLLKFAKSCRVGPDGHYSYSEEEVQAIFQLFTDKVNQGLSGVALGAVLENTSEHFIKDLAKRAKKLGCTDFTYTDKHGMADVKHSDEFAKALELELEMGYDDPTTIIQVAKDAAMALIGKIYA